MKFKLLLLGFGLFVVFSLVVISTSRYSPVSLISSERNSVLVEGDVENVTDTKEELSVSGVSLDKDSASSQVGYSGEGDLSSSEDLLVEHSKVSSVLESKSYEGSEHRNLNASVSSFDSKGLAGQKFIAYLESQGVDRQTTNFKNRASDLLDLAEKDSQLFEKLEIFLAEEMTPMTLEELGNIADSIVEEEPGSQTIINRLALDEERSSAVLEASLDFFNAELLSFQAVDAALVSLVNSDESYEQLQREVRTSVAGELPQAVIELAEEFYLDVADGITTLPFEFSDEFIYDNESYLSLLSEAVGQENQNGLQVVLSDFRQAQQEAEFFDSATEEALVSDLSDEQRVELFTSKFEQAGGNDEE